jgi:hypothetical protein
MKSAIQSITALLILSCGGSTAPLQKKQAHKSTHQEASGKQDVTCPPGTQKRHESGTFKESYCARLDSASSRWIRHGPALRWHSNGTLFDEGSYRDGSRDGPWKTYYDNGKLEKIWNYRGGDVHGAITEWDREGQKRIEGEMDQNGYIGQWKYWNAAGVLVLIERIESQPGTAVKKRTVEFQAKVQPPHPGGGTWAN